MALTTKKFSSTDRKCSLCRRHKGQKYVCDQRDVTRSRIDTSVASNNNTPNSCTIVSGRMPLQSIAMLLLYLAGCDEAGKTESYRRALFRF